MIKLIQKYLSEPSAVNIAVAIEEGIRGGEVRGADPLPPIRQLAEGLGVSPGTVSSAYRQLRLRGLVVSDGRRGTRVAALPEPEVLPELRGEGLTDLAVGNPDPALLPALGPALARLDPRPVLYGDALDHPPLVALMAERFKAEGVPGEELAVVGGAMDALERLLREELAPGDRVAVEDPAFSGILALLRALGLTPVPIPIDPRGMDPEALGAALAAGARAALVVPRAQNPTGAALDAPRADQLRAVLARYPDALYIEDDHAGPVAGVPLHTACAPGRPRQAHVRSFSKALGPDLRVAIVAGDGATLQRLKRRQAVGMRWVSHLLQRLAFELMIDPDASAQVARAGEVYSRRRQALVSALAAEGIDTSAPSGLNLWVPVPAETPAVQALWAAGFAVSPGARYRIKAPPAIRITTAALQEADAPRVARALAAALSPAGRSGPA